VVFCLGGGGGESGFFFFFFLVGGISLVVGGDLCGELNVERADHLTALGRPCTRLDEVEVRAGSTSVIEEDSCRKIKVLDAETTHGPEEACRL